MIDWNSIIGQVLTFLISVGVGFTIAYLKRKLGVEKMNKIASELENKKEWALLAVKFVQQSYGKLDGQDKFSKASEWLSNRATSCGIKITADEIKGLIESALREIKDKFGEDWANATKDNTPPSTPSQPDTASK